jgi:hypothetical protein
VAAVGAFVALAVGAALWFAAAGPAARAGAVASAFAATASTAAALTAIYLTTRALARTDQQLAAARQALVLSRYPLLLPIHQSVAFPDSTGRIAAHPPTEDRFPLTSPAAGAYAFVADTPGRYIVPIENVGEGPALKVSGRLWRSDGTMGEVVGPSALGAGKVAILTATVHPATDGLPAAFGALIRTGVPGACAYFWLDLTYSDVFGNGLEAQALFDPIGLGSWRHVAGGCYTSSQGSGG